MHLVKFKIFVRLLTDTSILIFGTAAVGLCLADLVRDR